MNRDKRDAYLEKAKAQLDEWNAELDSLEAKARGATADAKIKYDEEITAIRQRRDEAKRKFAEIQSASEDAWEQLKEGAEAAWNSLKEAVTKAKSQFK